MSKDKTLSKIPQREPSLVEWAYMAGIIDGEGSIGIIPGKAKTWKRHHLYVNLNVSNTDPRLTQWCANVFGGRVYGKNEQKRKQNPQWAPCTFWTIACKHAVWVLRGCLPYLQIKREQAEVAIAFDKTLGGPGIPVTEEIWRQRFDFRNTLAQLKGSSARGFRKSEEQLSGIKEEVIN